MITSVDTNILLDILLPDPIHQSHSLAKLHQAMQQGPLVMSEVVASELGAHFSRQDEMESFVRSVKLALVPMSLRSTFDAGHCWRDYLRTRKGPRERIVADFMIAAHALHHADRLLTRDLGFYRNYFKKLSLMD